MLWASAVLCFFRAGKITLPSPDVLVQAKHLRWGDAQEHNTLVPTLIRVKLKRRIRYFHQEKWLLVWPCGWDIDLHTRQLGVNQLGAIVRFRDGKTLTKTHLTLGIRSAIQTLGLPYNNFSSHSFRIGEATAVQKAGLEDSTIRTMRRWSRRSAFLAYIRTTT